MMNNSRHISSIENGIARGSEGLNTQNILVSEKKKLNGDKQELNSDKQNLNGGKQNLNGDQQELNGDQHIPFNITDKINK